MAQTLIRGTQIRDYTVGVTKLDSTVIGGDGKLLSTLLPSAIVGAMVYQGAFDASAGTVPAAASADNKGHYYIIYVAGVIDGVDYQVGDWIVSNGAAWDRVNNSEKTETAATVAYTNTTSGLAATDVQGAIDEVEGRLQTAEGAVGTLSDLTTTEKGSLVGAINELNANYAGAINELNAKSAGATYVRETPVGAVDGVNADFTISNVPYTGTLQVYLNGLLQELTDDYTVTGQTITLDAAPLAGDKVRVIYFKA